MERAAEETSIRVFIISLRKGEFGPANLSMALFAPFMVTPAALEVFSKLATSDGIRVVEGVG